jgi:FixJ family two-component response regulator
MDTLKQKRAERDKQILKLRSAGKTYLDIALALDISAATVNGTMSRYGIAQPRATSILKTIERNAEIRRLAGSMEPGEIATKFNLSAVRISQIIKAPRN